MAVNRKAASYHEKDEIAEFIGNPLISALPATPAQELLLKDLLKRPPFREKDREASGSSRLDLLSRINTVHIPNVQDLFIARNLSRVISWGYVSRNPMPFESTAGMLRQHFGDVTEELENYLTRTVFPIYGFSVLGISGVGKSCSVLNALMRYTQVIDHTEYNGMPFHCSQLVWLKVDTPGDGSPKGLCTAILRQIDVALGTDYHSEISSRISKDSLTTKVSQCLCSHHLGVLILDDIQNLCGAKKDTTADMLSFLIYLMETLAIPVVMVGTPKVLPLFQQEFQLAKRATGDGTVRMDLLAEGSKEWDRFIKGIWRYQFLRNPVPLTPGMDALFYRESVGNPFLCSLLYKLVQDDAITSYEESFTEEDVKKVAKEKLCITAAMRANMINGCDEELRRYEYLWAAAAMPVQDDVGFETAPEQNRPKKNILVSSIAAELAKSFSISPAQASKLAAQAVFIKGTGNFPETLGYAVQLCKAALVSDENDSEKPDEGNTPEG